MNIQVRTYCNQVLMTVPQQDGIGVVSVLLSCVDVERLCTALRMAKLDAHYDASVSIEMEVGA